MKAGEIRSQIYPRIDACFQNASVYICVSTRGRRSKMSTNVCHINGIKVHPDFELKHGWGTLLKLLSAILFVGFLTYVHISLIHALK